MTNKTIFNKQDLYRLILKTCYNSSNFTVNEIFDKINKVRQSENLKISENELSEMILEIIEFMKDFQLIVENNSKFDKYIPKEPTVTHMI